jgi:phthalate 4,5-dioxygenase oxygenase subunit
MLRHEDNERLVRVGPDQPAGKLFRRYWHPALLSSELAKKDGTPVKIRILCEDLVAFRDTNGKVGLVDAYCPHRRAPMFYGRNEECGLRCIYHGWKFDVNGQCVDQPTEIDDRLKENIQIKSYPSYENGGVIWIYMGPKEHMPLPPRYEWMKAPESHRFVSKVEQQSNYLQALEGGLDTAHVSHLHNDRIDDPAQLVIRDPAPRIEVYPTEYGYIYTSTRTSGDNQQYIRIYHYLMPFQQMRPNLFNLFGHGELEEIPTIRGHIWVPIDDEHTTVYNWIYTYDDSIAFTPEYIEKEEAHYGRGADDYIPGTFKLKRNPSNNHMIDRHAQKMGSATGITGLNTQDCAIQEGMGPIVDRSKEQLGNSDKAIIMMRRLMSDAITTVEEGKNPKGRDPETHAVRPHELIIDEDKTWQEIINNELEEKW